MSISATTVRSRDDKSLESSAILKEQNIRDRWSFSSHFFEDKGLSIDCERTNNIIITGDNLESLKLLLEGYSGKIGMIYIDPPYNTGKTFTFRDSIKRSDDRIVSAQKDSSVDDPHALWWNFMYQRLQVARELLRESGAIFISIDDNEIHNLRRMMNDIFGEKFFIATMIRQSGIAPRQDAKHVATQHDYVVCYAKDMEKVKLNRKPSALKGFIHEDEYVEKRGKYRLNKLDRGSIRYSESLDYPILAPDGSEVWPGGDPYDKKWTWRWSKKKVEWGVDNDFIVFKRNRDGKYSVYFKEYEFVDNKDKPRKRTNPYTSIITGAYNEKGNADLKALFKRRIFDYPKPVALIKHILMMATNKDSLVLDFFAGAGSTGHAVWELNSEDGGNRKFILIQNNEPVLDEDIAQDYQTVADICIERMRRVSKLYKSKEGNSYNDFGFKVLRIRQT